MSHQEYQQDHEHAHASRERLRQTLDEAATPEPDHRGQERNAIAVLAALVALLLLAMVTGSMGMFRP